MAVATVGGATYHIDDHLIKRWDRIKDGKLAKTDQDRVYIVDGREGSGKSLWTLQQAAYIDPTILIDTARITFSVEETLEAIRNTKSTLTETRVIVFDEAFRGLSNRAALSKQNKQLVQAMMEMRQNNVVLFIVLPVFFLLDMYAAMMRSNALFHIARSKRDNKRSFKMYGYLKKAKLYQIGLKKAWAYKVSTAVRGRFPNIYPGGDSFEALYRKKKLDSLRSMGNSLVPEKEEGRISLERKIGIANWFECAKSTKKITQSEFVEILDGVGVEMTRQNLGMLVEEVREKGLLSKKQEAIIL